MPSSMMHVRIDEQLKSEATAALATMGLTLSDAVKMLLTRVVSDQAFPLELKVPNAATRAAMEEARTLSSARFATVGTLFDDLENGDGR